MRALQAIVMCCVFAAGWHLEDSDQFMATDPGLLDPRRAVPNPGGA